MKKSFREWFRGSLRYLGESKNYVWAVALIFSVGILGGVIFSDSLSVLDEFLRDLVKQIEGLSTFGVILFILENNLKSSLFGIIFGVVLGIFPIISAVSNGLILGYVAKMAVLKVGVWELWRIFPHGIFELPAIFISLALGMKLGMFVFSKNRWKTFVERAVNSLIVFLCVVVPLLIVGAIIEGLLIGVYN